MAIKIQNNFVREDIVDIDGNKIGEIVFNPNDSRIMEKMIKIINDLTKMKDEIDNLGPIDENAFSKEAMTTEDFKKYGETYKNIHKGLKLENDYILSIINDLKEIFGNDTVELFTQGTYDVDLLYPLLEFVIPYVQEKRNSKVKEYLKENQNSDVME